MEHVAHYVYTRPAADYAGKRLFIIGKQNSGFELANGLLSYAQRIVLASPRPARTSIETNSLVGIRARYVQPVRRPHHGQRGAHPERGHRAGRARWRAASSSTHAPAPTAAAARRGRCGDRRDRLHGPLLDLPALGVATFGQSRLPAMTDFWESATVPGIYFAGTIMQGAKGPLKYGIPSNSGAVHGARYNARILARHIAERHFGGAPARPRSRPDALGAYLRARPPRRPSYGTRRATWRGC